MEGGGAVKFSSPPLSSPGEGLGADTNSFEVVLLLVDEGYANVKCVRNDSLWFIKVSLSIMALDP